ncbi:MAG: phospholipase [Burkholderiaceae bacterium]
MHALRLYAGPIARQHIEQHGLRPEDVGAIPAAAGGPKGLILGPLDRLLFGEWLPRSTQPVDLIGASIGAWRMATACLDDTVVAFRRLERDYISQHYEWRDGEKQPSADEVSRQFRHNLASFFGGREAQVLGHARYRLHVVASRGHGVLVRDGRWRTPLGYAAAFALNAVSRRSLAKLIDRVVFSGGQGVSLGVLPFATGDFPTHQVKLDGSNFMDALQASCSIPFVLRPVHNIAGAPPGAYWDGGITDYHMHLRYRLPAASPVVLYPHFQRAVVPGWLDKSWKRRHLSSPALDAMLVIAPDPQWVRSLPNGKLPDRTDFTRYGQDLAERVRVWRGATSAAQQLADEFAQWLERPDPRMVSPL